MIATVFGVIAAATASGSTQKLPGSMSTKTGSAPTSRAEAERHQRQLERGGAGVDGDAVPAADQVTELLLERGDLGALHDPAAPQHPDGRLDLGFADDRPCGGNELWMRPAHGASSCRRVVHGRHFGGWYRSVGKTSRSH